MAKVQKLNQSFNAGELSPLMDARNDQVKYQSGCRTMENAIPLIYGGGQERPGLEFIAGQKSNSAKGRVVGFEHSVDDTYVLLFENQVIRFFKDGAQVLDGVGTEDISGLNNVIAHWLLNDGEGVTVLDDNGNTHDGTATVDTGILSVAGKVGTGAFDLDGQYDVEISDHNDFSFTDNSNDDPFSIVSWGFVTQQNDLQVLLSKWKDSSDTSEWRFSLTNERRLQLHLADTSTDLSLSVVSQWKLNETAAATTVVDAQGTQNGIATTTTDNLTAVGLTNMTPCFDFDSQYAVEVADNAAYSFGDGVDDSPFSIAAWVFSTSAGVSQLILSKRDANIGSEAREWRFFINSSEKLAFTLYDESENSNRFQQTADTLTTGWHFVVATYDGRGGDDAEDGMLLYIDGSLKNTQRSSPGTYVAMENTATKVVIGANYGNAGTVADFFKDKLDNVILFDIELSQANIDSLYNSGDGTEDIAESGGTISAITSNALSSGWHFLCATYSAPANEATAADGIILYVDGIAVNSTATNNANYTAMQNGAEEVRIGSQRNSGDSANEKFWGDKIDEISVYSDVLTPTEVASLYSTTPFEITSPYLTEDLPTLKFEQSADVMFITHPSYESRRLSRLGDTVWTLAESDLQTGPFRDQNTDTDFTITASATTGSITLTASGTGNNPFVLGNTAGHEPSGSSSTSKSVTGALFKLTHNSATPSIVQNLNSTTLNAATDTLAVKKGVTWDFTTNGTWGTGGPSALVLERSFDDGSNYETVHTVVSLANKNIATSGTEDVADAIYRVRVSDGSGTGTANIHISIRDTTIDGIVEITSVTSSIEAIGTVLSALGSTDATTRWSEGSFSNRRGWPIDVTISSEERLTFAGNTSEPLTTWASAIGNFTDFRLGTDDDSALILTLVGSGQQNRITWILSKNTLVLGTVGGEHILGASKDDEALTPTNIRARLQTTYGSEDIAAKIVNQAVLFVQRGGRKIREFLYSFEQDSHKADDLTVFAEHITESGIVDMAFQRTPDPMLWCVRADGQIAVMTYERDQDVFSWARLVSEGGTSDAVFESVAVTYGGAGNEDEVWVSVKRVINTATTPTTVRYIERFYQRDLPASAADYKFLDSFITDTGGDTTITGLGHLEGERVQVLGDGLVQATKIVSSGSITAAATAAKFQVGLGYTATIKPMKLDIQGIGLGATKKINRTIANFFETIGGKVGTESGRMQATGIGTSLFTGSKEIPLSGGYSRDGDIIVIQEDPLPMTLLSLTHDVGVNND